MKTPVGPTVRRRELGRALKQLREASGLTASFVAASLKCTGARVSHIETGRNIPGFTELPALLTLYGALEYLEALEEIRAAANERGWWSTHRLPGSLQTYVGLEGDATSVRYFTLELVPGLVQTAEYTREAYIRHGTPEQELDRHVAFRMERQRQVAQDQDLIAVLSEAAIHRTAHMGDLGVNQLQHLIDLNRSHKADLRVLPFSVGGHRSMAGSFTVMNFPPGTISAVAYREGSLYGDLTDDGSAVEELQDVFDGILEQSLSRSASADLMAKVLLTVSGVEK